MNNVNPLKRLRNKAGLTIDQVVHQTGYSKSFIIKQEQGTYPEPHKALVLFYEQEAYAEILAEYTAWQTQHRKDNYGILSAHYPLEAYLSRLPITPVGKNPVHPLEFWRNHNLSTAVNLNQVSKALCVQQAVLFKFEKQPHLVNSVPDPLCTALIESGYSQVTINRFQLAFTEYKQYYRKVALGVSS